MRFEVIKYYALSMRRRARGADFPSKIYHIPCPARRQVTGYVDFCGAVDNICEQTEGVLNPIDPGRLPHAWLDFCRNLKFKMENACKPKTA